MLASDVVVLGIAGAPALVTTYTLVEVRSPRRSRSPSRRSSSRSCRDSGGWSGSGMYRRAARDRSETLSMVWLSR